MTWQEVIEHPSLQDLPFKIELNGTGKILMSPTRNSHGGRQFKIGLILSRLLPHGHVATELAVQTSDNVKVTDVAWLTPEHWQVAEPELFCSVAPAICVEVASAGNSRRELQTKKDLYFDAGAREVWLCENDGRMAFFLPGAETAKSALCPEFPLSI